MEAEVLGRIEIFVFKNGKCPMTVNGNLDEFQIQNVLSSLVTKVNQSMAAPKPVEITEEKKKKMHYLLTQLFGGEDGFGIIGAAAWVINRVAFAMSKDKGKNVIEVREPDVRLVN